MTTTSHRSDLRRFFLSWLANPLQVAAVAPSGKALADLMTREISQDSGKVLELGPGTGVFTRALLDRGVQEENLTLIEFGPEFADVLRDRFPQARVMCMDAGHLARRRLFSDSPVGAVVSGLPLLSMRKRKVMYILSGVLGCMRADGAIYQFTYGSKCPIPDSILERFYLKAERVGRTMLNVPPAAVYRITRRPLVD